MENPFEILLEKLTSIEDQLRELKIRQPEKAPDELMNMEQTAEYLHIAKQTLYGYTSSRLIPHCKAGKRIYFQKSELDNWINRCRVKTMDEIQKEAMTYISGKGKPHRSI